MLFPEPKYTSIPFRIQFDTYNPFDRTHEGYYAFLSDALIALCQHGKDITKITTAERYQEGVWHRIDPTILTGEIQHALILYTQQGGRS